jgi:hypothetical protein
MTFPQVTTSSNKIDDQNEMMMSILAMLLFLLLALAGIAANRFELTAAQAHHYDSDGGQDHCPYGEDPSSPRSP